MAVPNAARCRGLNSYAAFLFLIHEVGGRGAIVHLANLVDLAREFQDTFGRGGLARVNVGKNANISVQR